MTIISAIKNKIKTWDEAAETRAEWRKHGEKTVFTNGCFDILHYGHVHYLADAAGLGDRLIIGLNSAGSVSRLKGPHRPINDEFTRQTLLAALGFVDMVVVFEEDTPLKLIELLAPDILVKGGDYPGKEGVVGWEIVEEYGGEVRVLGFVDDVSTTAIVNRILEDNAG